MQTTVWRLTAFGPLEVIRAAGERLNAADEAPALGWSMFEEADPETARLDILFGAQPDAGAFSRDWGLEREDVEVLFGPLPEEDWVAMSLQGLPPVEAGRFVLHGAHTPSADIPADRTAILIEAGPAFGTGHHGTTKGCLIALDRLAEEDRAPATILDLGTGTGALAIAAAKVWPEAGIIASDIDADSVAETIENAQKNGVEHRIEAIEADGFAHPRLDGPFDLILANILAGPLQDLARDLAARAAPGGVVVLSGLLEHQEAPVRQAYADAGLSYRETDIIDGWVILTFDAG